MSTFQVPFSKSGNMLFRLYDRSESGVLPTGEYDIIAILKDNFYFISKLTIVGMRQGKILLSNTYGRTFMMFPTEFVSLCKRGGIGTDGLIEGVFTFTKRSDRYGIKWLGKGVLDL
jgi:hypothetical protein